MAFNNIGAASYIGLPIWLFVTLFVFLVSGASGGSVLIGLVAASLLPGINLIIIWYMFVWKISDSKIQMYGEQLIISLLILNVAAWFALTYVRDFVYMPMFLHAFLIFIIEMYPVFNVIRKKEKIILSCVSSNTTKSNPKRFGWF